jgi:hypothetical protein
MGDSELYVTALQKADVPADAISWHVALPAKNERIKRASPQRMAKNLRATTRPACRMATTQTAGYGRTHEKQKRLGN